MPCRFRHIAGWSYPYIASISQTECQASSIVASTEPVVVVVVRPVVVPIATKHTGVRAVVPVAGSQREKHVNSPPYSGCGIARKLRTHPPIIAPSSFIRTDMAVYLLNVSASSLTFLLL